MRKVSQNQMVGACHFQSPPFPGAAIPRFHLIKILSSLQLLSIQYYFSLIQLPPNKDSFITPSSIYAVFFSLIQLPLNKDFFITPSSIYTVLLSLIQLILLQYSFH